MISKKDFCKKLTGRTIISITPDCPEADDWCETLVLELDNGETLKIAVGSDLGECCLVFKL